MRIRSMPTPRPPWCFEVSTAIISLVVFFRGGSSRVRMKKKNLEDNDFYDEDDDLYFDRTGQLELQRDKRKMWTMVGISFLNL